MQVQQVRFQPERLPEPAGAAAAPQPPLFPTDTELSVDVLVQQVLARSPSLAEMIAAWQAAQARYPQVTSLDDPMLDTKIGPASIGSNKVDFAYMVELSQKLPFPGRLGLRGDRALAQAAAAGRDVETVRLQLIETARHAFYDYYLADRRLAENDKSLELLQDVLRDVRKRYEAPGVKVALQDVLQVQVEIGRQRERQLTLERLRQVAMARINTLMHLEPDAPLPPPSKEIKVDDALPEARVLRASALAQRPDLQAVIDHIRAEQAALALAQRDFYPDFDLMAAYDAFWRETELRPAVGVKLNLPVWQAKRHAAVAEAQARLAERQAEFDKLTDQVNFEVQEAYAQVRESQHAVRLYDKILSDAAENVKAAQRDYMAGLIPAVSYLEAERSQVDLAERSYEALAAYFRRRATLERVIGGPLTLLAPTPDPPLWQGLPTLPPGPSAGLPAPRGPDPIISP